MTGLGLGLTMPPSLNVAMGALTASRSGVGNAVLQALRQVGGAVGVAVLGTVLNTGYRHHLPAGAPPVVARRGGGRRRGRARTIPACWPRSGRRSCTAWT